MNVARFAGLASRVTALVTVRNGLAEVPFPVVSLPLTASTKIVAIGVGVAGVGLLLPRRVHAVPPTIPAAAAATTSAKKARVSQDMGGAFSHAPFGDLGERKRSVPACPSKPRRFVRSCAP